MTKQGGLLLLWLLSSFCDTSYAHVCSPDPCQNEGVCRSLVEGGYRCTCKYGWYGLHCEVNVNDCRPGICQNGGTCQDLPDNKYFCKCLDNFIGINCEHRNPCISSPCKNNGKCDALLNGQMNCKCQKNFSGDFCEIQNTKCPVNLYDRRKLCSLHGQCTSDQGRLQCSCDVGYTGPYCQKRIIVVGCDDNFCLNGGTCINENGNPFCKCAKGYSGVQCSSKDEELVSPSTYSKISHMDTEPLLTNASSRGLPIEIVPECSPRCVAVKNNGKCDQRCNTERCQYDGGDCDPWNKCTLVHCRDVFRDDQCNSECNNVDCLFDGQDCDSSTCINSHYCSTVYQNKICNEVCNNPQCGFDGGDCKGKQTDSFFSNVQNVQQCSTNRKEFELDLILLTTKRDFLLNKSTFLQTLGSALKMVLTISKITPIIFNSTSALSIKLKINPTQCIIYGGQCFSSLDQISNFIKAGISGHDTLSLPFKVAKVDSKTVYSVVPIPKARTNTYFLVLVSMGSALVISLIVIGVLLRDKWGRLRTKVKTAGVWTPSEGYSTSTSSINSNQKPGWQAALQPHHIKLDHRLPNTYNYENELFKYNNMKVSRLCKNNNIPENNSNYNRKRKYETIETDGMAVSFQLISDLLQKRDGINPVMSNQAKVISIINDHSPGKGCLESRYGGGGGGGGTGGDPQDGSGSPSDLGSYVNDDGESLLHIASRMNCGAVVIKRLHSLSPAMLHSTDEWGRTPLATAVAADAFESVEQLLLLEKQFRKESKQNKSRVGVAGVVPGTGGVTGSSSCASATDTAMKRTTGLIESVKLNSGEMINLLLDEGSPVNVLDSGGRSVVHWAAIFDNAPLLERLSHMKIFQKLVDLKDNDEHSPLYLAASEGSLHSATFIVEYITKLGLKIDPIFPCPRSIAAENGFPDIEALIDEAQLPSLMSEKTYKRMKQRDHIPNVRKMVAQKRGGDPQSSSSSSKPLAIINEYKELSSDSVNMDKQSPASGLDSLESCLLDMYSLEESSLTNILDSSCPDDRNPYSSFKPQDNNCHGYLSNTSSSDMSPPLLNLKMNPALLNGYHCYSDQLDPALHNSFFLGPSHQTALVTKGTSTTHHQVGTGVAKMSQQMSSDVYQLEPSSRIDPYHHHQQYQHRSLNMMNLPSINCPQ